MTTPNIKPQYASCIKKSRSIKKGVAKWIAKLIIHAINILSLKLLSFLLANRKAIINAFIDAIALTISMNTMVLCATKIIQNFCD